MLVFNSGDDELTVDTEYQTVYGYEIKPDVNWRFVDDVGHRHSYWSEGDPYPTLEERERPSYCCEECEACDDPNGVEQYYVCKECSQEVVPRKKRLSTSQNVKTTERYILKTVRTVSKEEAEAWMREKGLLNVPISD